MFKNLSIRSLTLYVTGIIVFTNALILVLYFSVVDHFETPYFFLLFLLLSVIVNFYFIKLILDKAVFRKIKVIYKIIRDNKLSKKEKEGLEINVNSLETVNEDVVNWTKSTQEELNYLKALEVYRKTYVGNISHELKTPLFSIQGYLHTLMDGGLYDESINQKYLQKAVNNVDRLQHIIEDLENISKLENENKVKIASFDIKALVDEVIEDLQMMAKNRGIQLTFKEGTVKSFKVNADKEMIRQVLNNLIVNSIKYGKDNGTTKISFYDLDKQVLVEISDNGLGIEEKHLKHLFDRFYRVDNSRSRKMGGSGLGLSIVKHIIEAHKQSINVRSTLDLGSTFGFTLAKA